MKCDVSLLHHYFICDPDAGTLVRRITAGHQRAGSKVGALRPDGYLMVIVEKKGYLVHRVIWAMAIGSWPTNGLDHINGVKTDNRLANLRDVPQRTNNQNRNKVRAQVGLLGVSKNGTGFGARIRDANGKATWLGTYRTAEEAHQAYLAAKRVREG